VTTFNEFASNKLHLLLLPLLLLLPIRRWLVFAAALALME
jgi:hypothetical protein